MRTAGFIAAIALALAPSGAGARPVPVGGREPAASDFWREVIEPHFEEVRVLIDKTRRAMQTSEASLQGDAEWAVELRLGYYRDAYHLMKYARTLAPANAEVLALLGRAADETGRTRQAVEALTACLELTGPDRAYGDVLARLGAIYLRRGDRDTAIRYLRLAQGPAVLDNAVALVHLANALAERGEVTAALDVLITALPRYQLGYYSLESTLMTYTLAVIYDRDEQRGAAFAVLDRLRSTLASSFGSQLQTSLAQLRYARAEDQHYYLGLLYEIEQQYVEARAEFALYAASGATPWRARALEHVRDIDAERRSPRPSSPPVVPVPPPILPTSGGMP